MASSESLPAPQVRGGATRPRVVPAPLPRRPVAGGWGHDPPGHTPTTALVAATGYAALHVLLFVPVVVVFVLVKVSAALVVVWVGVLLLAVCSRRCAPWSAYTGRSRGDARHTSRCAVPTPAGRPRAACSAPPTR